MGWIQNANGSVTDERTGMEFMTVSIGESLGYGGGTAAVTAPQTLITIPASASSPGGIDSRARAANGNLITNQTRSSQFWMDAGYVGQEPDLEVKQHYSSADYAYQNAQAIAADAVKKYGETFVSPAIAALVDNHNVQNPINIQSPQIPQSLNDLMKGANLWIDWLAKNALLVVIVIGVIIVLPRLLSAAIPSGRR